MAKEGKKGPGFIKGMVLGGIVGTAIGMLMAPRSGKETRDDLAVKGTELRAIVDQLTSQARERVDETVAQARTTIGGERQSIQAMAEDVKEILHEVMAEAKEVLREAVEEGKVASNKATADLQARFEQARRGQN